MSRQARVGLIVIAATLFFLVGLFAIANRTFLFSDNFYIQSRFNHVAGLHAGQHVQYQGVNVGRVESVELPDTPGDRIAVRMAISERARHVIRRNTRAQIKTDGLVGSQIVVLISPSEVGDPIQDNDIIVGEDPMDFFEITDRALVSVQNFEKAANTFEQIMLDVRNGEGTLGKIIYDSTLYYSIVSTATESRNVMDALVDNAEALVELAGGATEGVNSILTAVEEGDGTISKLLNDPELYNRLLAAADTVQYITGDMRTMIENFEQTSNWGALGAFRFAELMEAAKHNWLFKRYFEERGYMEKASFEIREKALEESFDKLAERELELARWQERLERGETKPPSDAAADSTSTNGSSQE
ncbi:MAG: MCE family protein [Bacteroidetes bacterium]|nr:MCE family protein [Bacteroidota bacterium]